LLIGTEPIRQEVFLMTNGKVVRPLNVLNQSINNRVIVELKAGREYRGLLEGFDPHMNLVIKNAEEIHNGEVKKTCPLTIVRGDNVIYISP
jgi:small nuclear ribonucleoprotein